MKEFSETLRVVLRFEVMAGDIIDRSLWRMVGNINQNSWAVGSIAMVPSRIPEHVAEAEKFSHIALESSVIQALDGPIGNIDKLGVWDAWGARNLARFCVESDLLPSNIRVTLGLACGGRRLVRGPFRLGDSEVMLSGDPIYIWVPHPSVSRPLSNSTGGLLELEDGDVTSSGSGTSSADEPSGDEFEKVNAIPGDPCAREPARAWQLEVLSHQQVHDEFVEARLLSTLH